MREVKHCNCDKVMLIIFLFFPSIEVFSAALQTSLTLPEGAPIVTISRVKEDAQGKIIEFLPGMTSLDFGSLREVFDTRSGKSLNIFLPDRYFAIDVALGNGGTPSTPTTVALSFEPLEAGFSLGKKATVTFVKTFISNFPETHDDLGIPGGGKLLLENVRTKTFVLQDLSPGWLRMYLGIVTKDPRAVIPDPEGSEVFTPIDPAGVYSGKLQISFL